MKKTNKIIITAIITAVIFASMAGCVMDKQTKQAVSDLNSVISSISKTILLQITLRKVSMLRMTIRLKIIL